MSGYEYEGKDPGRDIDRDFEKMLRESKYDLSRIASAEESMRDFVPKALRDKQKLRERSEERSEERRDEEHRDKDTRSVGDKGGSGSSTNGPVASGETPPQTLPDRQKLREHRYEEDGHSVGAKGGSNSSPNGSVASGGVPPQPQRNEPGDEVSSEVEVAEEVEDTPQTEVAPDEVTTADPEPDEAENETEGVVEQESSEQGVTEKPPEKKKKKKRKKKNKEGVPGPLQLRGVNGEPLDVTVLGIPRFSYEGEAAHPREIPMAVVTAIRQELIRLGAPELGDGARAKPLSTSSLLTALAMSALDLEIPGVDENTKRAAEVLRTGQGRIVAVESKVEQVAESQEETYQQLRLVRERSVNTEKLLQELELVMTWLLVDRITPQIHNTADPNTIELAHKTVLSVRSRLRKQADQLREDELLRQGRGQIVE